MKKNFTRIERFAGLDVLAETIRVALTGKTAARCVCWKRSRIGNSATK